MNGDKVGESKQCLQRCMAELGAAVVVDVHLHADALGQVCQMASDAPVANDKKVRLAQRVSLQSVRVSLPIDVSNIDGALLCPLIHNGSETVLCYLLRAPIGVVGDRDVPLLAGCQIDVVEAGTLSLYQLWQRGEG